MKKILLSIITTLICLPITVKALEFQTIYDEFFPEGKVKVSAVNPKGETSVRETVVHLALRDLFSKNTHDDINFSYFEFDTTKCPDHTCGYIEIFNDEIIEKYLVNLEFFTPNEMVSKKVNAYADKFRGSGEAPEDNLFVISDLEIINYMLAGGYNSAYGVEIENAVINYSLKFKEILANTNIRARLQVRAGWGMPGDLFTSGGFGDLMFYYNDNMYAYVDQGGVKGHKVIYIPTTTKDTTDDYINAALKRIEDYVGKDKVTLKLGGKITDLDETASQYPASTIVNLDNTLGEYYILTILGEEHYFLIEKNDELMQENPTFITKDLETDVSIETEESEVPLDSHIRSKRHDKDSNTYKELMKKLNKEHGMVYDIDLYSTHNKKYITKLANGKFRVKIPVDKIYEGKKIAAFYVHEDGKIDTHIVTVKDNYAEFETDHFSIYTIAEVKEEDNIVTDSTPETGDNIIIFMVLAVISIMGIGLGTLYLKKN